MSQELILKNLAAFLDKVVEGNQKPKLAAQRAQFVELLKKDLTGHGFCFGFSVCHAAMDAIGKLDWWEAALMAVANWDGKQDPQQTFYVLPGSRTNKPVTLASIMKRVLNYVVQNHASSSDKSYQNFKLQDTKQAVFLKEQTLIDEKKSFNSKSSVSKNETPTHYFEILDEKNQVKTIQHKIRLTGYMSDKQLNKFLDAKMIEGNLVMASSLGHTVRLGFKNNKWFIYNPNDPHNLKKSLDEKKEESPHIYKEFDTKEEMILALTKKMGNTLDLEFATLDPKRELLFPEYEKLLQSKDASKLFLEDGLVMIGRYAPEYFESILEMATDAPEDIASGFIQRGHGVYSPGLHHIMKLDNDSPPIKHFERLIQIASESKEFPGQIALSISDIDEKQQSGLHMTLLYHPELLPILLKAAEKSNEWPRQAADALQNEDKHNLNTGLHMLAKYAPAAIVVRVIEASGKSKHGARSLLSALCAVNKAGKTGRHALHKFPAKEKENILNAIVVAFSESLKQVDKSLVVQMSRDLASAATDPESPYRNLCKKQHYGMFKDYSKTTLWKLLSKAAADRVTELTKDAKDEKKHTPPDSLSL
jgi:hypothetical protein